MDGSNGKIVELLERIANGQDATNARLDATIVEMHVGFASLDSRLEATNQRLDATNQRIEATNQRLEATNARLDATNQRLDATNQRLDATIVELRDGFARVTGRLDNMVTFLGAHYRDHEDRIRALEDKLIAKSG